MSYWLIHSHRQSSTCIVLIKMWKTNAKDSVIKLRISWKILKMMFLHFLQCVTTLLISIIKKERKISEKVQCFTDLTTGERSIMTFRHGIWHHMHVVNPRPNCDKWKKLFHNLFRLPHFSYLYLLSKCESSIFDQWGSSKVNGHNKKEGFPIEWFVLAALHYLGRAWALDDLQEAEIINAEKIQLLIHTFIEHRSTVLHDSHVVAPKFSADLAECSKELNLSGISGCAGSTGSNLWRNIVLHLPCAATSSWSQNDPWCQKLQFNSRSQTSHS